MPLLPTCWNIASKLVQADVPTLILKSNCSIHHHNPVPCRNNHNIISPMVNIICTRPCNGGALSSAFSTARRAFFLPLKQQGADATTAGSRVSRNVSTVQTHNPISRRLIFPSNMHLWFLSRSLLKLVPTSYLPWSGGATYYPDFWQVEEDEILLHLSGHVSLTIFFMKGLKLEK